MEVEEEEPAAEVKEEVKTEKTEKDEETAEAEQDDPTGNATMWWKFLKILSESKKEGIFIF